MPVKYVTRPQDDYGLAEVDMVRDELIRMERLAKALAASGHTGLYYDVEDAMTLLFKAANDAEDEIHQRQMVVVP